MGAFFSNNIWSSQPDQLVTDLQMGDGKAFAYFFNVHYNGLVKLAYAITGDGDESEDIAAEAMAKLWQMRKSFDQRQSIASFLRVSVDRSCRNYVRYVFRVNEDIRQYNDWFNSWQDFVFPLCDGSEDVTV